MAYFDHHFGRVTPLACRRSDVENSCGCCRGAMTALYCAGTSTVMSEQRCEVALHARAETRPPQRTKVLLMCSRPPMSSSDTSMTAGLTTSSASTCSALALRSGCQKASKTSGLAGAHATGQENKHQPHRVVSTHTRAVPDCLARKQLRIARLSALTSS